MESTIEHAAANVLGEAFDELVGHSKRKWALVLLAFFVGAVTTALVVIKFAKRGATVTAGEPDADDTVTPSGTQASEARFEPSAWTRRRAQIARSELAMRARAGNFGSRLNVRRMRRRTSPPSDALT